MKYGTRHVLVLTGFPPSTKTAYLEKLLENFKDRGVVIRWVNDTVALAVFRTSKIGNNVFKIIFEFLVKLNQISGGKHFVELGFAVCDMSLICALIFFVEMFVLCHDVMIGPALVPT